MIYCLLCNYKTKGSLVPHIRSKHNISTDLYKKKTGGEVYSDEYKKKISDNVSIQMKTRWMEDKEFRDKHLDLLHSKGIRVKIGESLKKKYDSGEIKSWNIGLTKNTDDRLKHIGEVNRQHLLGRTKDNFEYIKYAQIKRSKSWYNKSKLEQNEIIKKRSKSWCESLSRGEHKPYCKWKFKCGYYNGEYYRSSLELSAMKFFDSCNVIKNWTTKHGVVINYYSKYHKEYRNYVPDFKITLINDKEIFIETKGNGLIKIEEYKNMIYDKHEELCKHYDAYLCFNLNEIKEVINEVF